jgi:hypothetical protein
LAADGKIKARPADSGIGVDWIDCIDDLKGGMMNREALTRSHEPFHWSLPFADCAATVHHPFYPPPHCGSRPFSNNWSIPPNDQ